MKQIPNLKKRIKILFILVLLGLAVGNCDFSTVTYNPIGPGILWSTF